MDGYFIHFINRRNERYGRLQPDKISKEIGFVLDPYNFGITQINISP